MDSSVAEPAAAGPHYHRPVKTIAAGVTAQKDSDIYSEASRAAD